MLTQLPQTFPIEAIVDQVIGLGYFGKRLDLNKPTGEFFNDPWTTKDEFNNTPLGNVLANLGNIGQARLLCLESGETYTAHCDPDDRIHLAIITNPFSYIVNIDDETLYHLPADGQLWHMNTGIVHIAVNWGSQTRVHLNVRVLLPKYDPTKSSLRIKVCDGDYDWKQVAYMPIMQIVNKHVKNGSITGFKGISDKEIMINTEHPELFNSAFEKIKNAGVILDVA